MATRREMEKRLRLISKAWGRRQEGYCFFPWIDREAQARAGSRRAGYHEGPDPKNPAFEWPKDRAKILDHMMAHQDHDLYWCPSLFEYPARRTDIAMDEHALWADLDEADPRLIEDYPPTIAWESSPGRYQALWLAAAGDFQGASWPGNENQRMTYHVEADASGWDTTQLLRIPGWVNHKPENVVDGKHPTGKLLWDDGQQYMPGDFSELPEVQVGGTTQLTDALESEIDGVDRHQVMARVRLKMTHRAREMLTAREISGDRSQQLWYLTRSLADVGCSVAEIVAIVRETVWNKFRDRSDELRVLISEASKAIAARQDSDDSTPEPEEIDRTPPQRFGMLLKNVKRPKFLIDGILTEGACGFIAGEPKCYKSWIGLDMALSVSTGADFLGEFPVRRPGPVLYIQEEDPLPTLKDRTAKIWTGKSTDKLEVVMDGEFPEVMWLPPQRDETFDPDIHAYVQRGVTISDEAWQIWLDEIMAEGMNGEPYRLLIIDTLMMTAGDVDENRAQEMTTKVFKPTKTLARKHNTAFQFVHHMGKSDKARSGQRMLGSVANHAWSEDSLYLSRTTSGDVRMELESKSAPSNTWRIGNLANRAWEPSVSPWRASDEPEAHARSTNAGQPRERTDRAKKQRETPAVIKQLDEMGGAHTTAELNEATGVSRSQVWRQLRRAEEAGLVTRHAGPDGVDLWEKVA